MTGISEKTRVVPASDILSTQVDGDLVLLRMADDTYYGMEPIGVRIWAAIENGASAEEIAHNFAPEFKLSVETCTDDVLTFLRDLVSQQLAVVVPA